MAVYRIQQAGGYPNTPLSVGLEQMFEGGARGFDNTTISIGPDPMENLAWPPKVYQAAKVALDDARAAGKRFTAAKLDLQRRVLNAWFGYVLLAERARIQERNLALLRLITKSSVARVQAGAQRQDLLRAGVEQRRAEDELKTLESELSRARTVLNALAARAPDAPLRPPERKPDPRPRLTLPPPSAFGQPSVSSLNIRKLISHEFSLLDRTSKNGRLQRYCCAWIYKIVPVRQRLLFRDTTA